MRILFQGDSITDAGRSRDNDEFLGTGYALLVEAQLGLEEPTKYEFINRGVGGDRITDVYARIKKDIINVEPDVISFLVGINDVWHECNKNGVDAEKYYKIYDMLIEEVKAALPNVKIMIMEPFCLNGYGITEAWDFINSETKLRSKMAQKIAQKYNLPFIKLQEGFDKLSEIREVSYWLSDGVHPTPKGHEFIKNEWIKAFKAL